MGKGSILFLGVSGSTGFLWERLLGGRYLRQGMSYRLSNAHLFYIMDKLKSARWQHPMEKDQNWIRMENIFCGAQGPHEQPVLKTSLQ